MPPRKPPKAEEPETSSEAAESHPADEAAPEEHDNGGITLSSLAEDVQELKDMVTNFVRSGTGPRQSQQDQAAEMARQVTEESRKIAAAEKREGERQSLADRVKKLEEVPPREYRRITKIMWGSDEDE